MKAEATPIKIMTYDEAVQKATKLLRLATSDNPNEATLAASRAQDIMDRYKLGSLSLNYEANGSVPDEPIKDFESDPLDAGTRRLASWRWRLFHPIARCNQCDGYVSGYGGIAVVGRPSDVSTVRYLYGWLTREVDRLAERDCRGNGRTYANNYRIGVVETISERLAEQSRLTVAEVQREAEAQQSINPMALVRVNQAVATLERRGKEVEQWIKSHLMLSSSSTSHFKADGSAREAGRIAGREVRLKAARAQIGT